MVLVVVVGGLYRQAVGTERADPWRNKGGDVRPPAVAHGGVPPEVEAASEAGGTLGGETPLAATVARFGRVDACVNCAGLGAALLTVDKKGKPHAIGAFNRIIQINLVGT